MMHRAQLPASLGLALLFAMLLLASKEGQAQSSSAGTLRVVVNDVRNEKGVVRVHLWNRDDRYPRDLSRSTLDRAAKIKGNRAVIVFRELPHGTWAAFAYHDEDSNGEIRSNWIGMPKEGVGASKNARGRMGPPSFEDAAISFIDAQKTIAINLRYL